MTARPQRVLFVGGLGRSGSTLVEKMLNELPAMFAVGETVHLWERGVRDDERCGCGQAFSQCAHWSAVGEAAFGSWSNVDLDAIIERRWSLDRSRRLPSIARAHRRGLPSAEQSAYVGQLRRVLLASAEVANHPAVLVESSKHLSTAALLALDPALDVRLLHLVRDPRGVAHSWMKAVSRPEADGQLMPTYRPSRTASRWVTDNLGFELLAHRVPTLRLRYEDFMADPAEALTAIAHLVDLTPDDVELGFLHRGTSEQTAAPTFRAIVSTPMHSVAGNPLRFGPAEVPLRLDDGWRTGLRPADRRVVTAIAAPGLLRYRYPLRTGLNRARLAQRRRGRPGTEHPRPPTAEPALEDRAVSADRQR